MSSIFDRNFKVKIEGMDSESAYNLQKWLKENNVLDRGSNSINSGVHSIYYRKSRRDFISRSITGEDLHHFNTTKSDFIELFWNGSELVESLEPIKKEFKRRQRFI